MLTRQYAALGLKPAAVTAVDHESVLFIDADNEATLCFFSDDDSDDDDVDLDADDDNEFYDEDADKVYDECGDVRVLMPAKQFTLPPVFENDLLVACALSSSSNTTALLYTSGYFQFFTDDAAQVVKRHEIPKDIAAEAWIVSDTHLFIGATVANSSVDADDTAFETAALVYLYVLPDVSEPRYRIANPAGQRALHVATFTSGDAFVMCANSDALFRMDVDTCEFQVLVKWAVPDIHSIACDGGLLQSSDVKLFMQPRGLIVLCNGLLQVYALSV